MWKALKALPEIVRTLSKIIEFIPMIEELLKELKSKKE